MSRRNLLIGAGTVIAGITAAPYLGITLPNPFYTPGVKNIEKRYTAGGGSPHHLPAVATKRGNDNIVEGNQVGGNKGIGSQRWEERVGKQRDEPGAIGKRWNDVHYGNEKGK